ncbi:histidine phosphatase superfamily [Chaetomium sp. MPI-SDFR-AT-0129]|nr:histidine phosphatase superfamily [Chaetomium sp. MPI-SDFR-AT-0129]
MHTALAIAGLATTAAAETVHGALVFVRHGDRTAKHLGPTSLTPVGASEVFEAGTFTRARYLSSSSPHHIRGMSEAQYVSSQVYASAPDEPVLFQTATSFLQALYPPLGQSFTATQADKLANGSSVPSPLNGYQYVMLHGINADSPETVWIKGDVGCPTMTAAQQDFNNSAVFQTRLEDTRAFYQSLYPMVSELYDAATDLDYTKAFDIFDLFNVQKIHNSSSPIQKVSDDQLFQLRTLADSAEFGANWNASQPDRALHARTFAAAVLDHLNQTVSTSSSASSANTKAAPKLTVLAGSYDTFLAFFGLTRLTEASPDFYGLPDYASTMMFELFTPGDNNNADLDESALRVRYMLRNGTTNPLRQFPLFGSKQADLPWTQFRDEMQKIGISTTAEWCSLCDSPSDFCAAFRDDGSGNGVSVQAGNGEVAVARGAWIAVLVVMAVAILGNLIWAAMWLFRGRKESRVPAAAVVKTAGSTGTGSVRSYGKESV